MKTIHIVLVALSLASPGELHAAELRFAGIFTEHAVLQRETPVPVWGWAGPGERITVQFAGQKKAATADATGRWLVRLDGMPANGKPRELKASGEGKSVTCADVVVGDVWLCSGQSNMGIPMVIPGNDYLQRRIAEARNPQLRLFATLHQFPDAPVSDTRGQWSPAKPESVKHWIAIGYLFGERIQRETGVPIGILVSAMGGTCIESWLPRDVLHANPVNRPYVQNHQRDVERLPVTLAQYERTLADFNRQFPDGRALSVENATRQSRGQSPLYPPPPPDGQPGSPRNPSACFHGKIAPILPYALKGVLWYQGEGNVSGFAIYPSQMADLMRSWRELFQLPSLPFLMTELAPFGQPSPHPQDSARARFSEALAKTARTDRHAWVITIVDGGDPVDIHPAKKEIPAERFAAMALAKVYGKAVVAHGPLLKSWKAENGQAVVKFDSVGGGLLAKTLHLGGHRVDADTLQGFELAGADKKFFRAEARIEGEDTVVAQSANVPSPMAMRYAWAAFPLCNLFNAEGLAAYPFRTDEWPWKTPPDR